MENKSAIPARFYHAVAVGFELAGTKRFFADHVLRVDPQQSFLDINQWRFC